MNMIDMNKMERTCFECGSKMKEEVRELSPTTSIFEGLFTTNIKSSS